MCKLQNVGSIAHTSTMHAKSLLLNYRKQLIFESISTKIDTRKFLSFFLSSVGIEDVDDLRNDLEQALEKVQI